MPDSLIQKDTFYSLKLCPGGPDCSPDVCLQSQSTYVLPWLEFIYRSTLTGQQSTSTSQSQQISISQSTEEQAALLKTTTTVNTINTSPNRSILTSDTVSKVSLTFSLSYCCQPNMPTLHYQVSLELNWWTVCINKLINCLAVRYFCISFYILKKLLRTYRSSWKYVGCLSPTTVCSCSSQDTQM